MMERRYRLMSRYVMVLVLLVCMNGVAVGQEIRQSLFHDAEAAAVDAKKAHADILAPKSFGKAMDYYSAAETDFNKGKNIEKIKGKLDEAIKYFQKSVDVATLSQLTFPDTIQARSDAQKARAHEFSPDLWVKAEEKFKKAGVQLEKKGVAADQKSGDEALTLYREAELDAIQNHLLNNTRSLIQEAEQAKAEDFAPKTLQSAKALLQQAEEALVKDRYDTEPVRELTRLADSEAKHALYLSNEFRKIKSNAMTLEEYALDFEGLLERIAAPANIDAEFDNGMHKTAVDIIVYIENVEKSKKEQAEQIQNLEAEIAQLQEKLGIARTDSLALQEQVKTQAIIREKFAQVDTLFTKDQAHVFRAGDNIYLRMVGLNFDVGQSVLKPENYGLLTKALEAIKIFPDSQVIVEGHTDSQGSDKLNLALSRERAEAVRKYIAANMDMEPDRSSSEGYGKTRPIANNETAEGRAMNRRIDIVIIPNLEMMATGQPSI